MRQPDLSVKWMDLVTRTQRYADINLAQADLAQAAMLTGEEFTLFGRRVRVRLEWIDEPFMSEDDLRAYGESMRASAKKRLAS